MALLGYNKVTLSTFIIIHFTPSVRLYLARPLSFFLALSLHCVYTSTIIFPPSFPSFFFVVSVLLDQV